MTEPRLEYVVCASRSGLHRMAYWEWGDPANDKVLVCVHGLTRSGRDFDTLAARLSPHYRVVCPDVVGRGRSDWLADPTGYVVPQYVADMVTLIARLGVERIDWLGTSMGGLIGLALAGALAMSAPARVARAEFGLLPERTLRLGKMVLNDIGPQLNLGGLARIGEYVGRPGVFDSYDQAVDYVQSVSEGFGPHSRAQWEQLTRHVFNHKDGRWVKHYDLAISKAFALQTPQAMQEAEALLWASYASLSEPVLIVRGAQSDLLLRETAADMLARNPRARLFEVPGVGHAPTLLSPGQIEPIADFLLAP
jgi:pimeloyl-ACP methyl ester carboxylesterase